MESIDIVTWYAMKLLLWLGGTSIVAWLAILAAMVFYAGYVLGGFLGRREKPMQAQKLDHVKYDILPDGTLGPGDNRNLEGPE